MLFQKRLIFANTLIMILAIIIVFAAHSTFVLANRMMEVPFFSQVNPDWKEKFLDNSPFTIGASGCALTSTAMLVSYYGVDTDPSRLNQALTPIGGIDIHGILHWDIVPQVCEGKIEWIERIDGCEKTPEICWNRIETEIDLGYPVIADLRTPAGNQHFIVFKGQVGENYYFYDPADPEETERTWPIGYHGEYDMVGLRIYHGILPEPSPTTWPFLQRDLENTGNNPDALTIENPKLGDSFTIEGAYGYAQPVVENNMVYVASSNGIVYASDMEKQLCAWGFDTGADEIKVTPALDTERDRLYVLDSNNILWCLDQETGNWIWYLDLKPYGLDYYWQTSPQIYQDYVCFTIGPYAVFIKDDIIQQKVEKINSNQLIQSSNPDFLATAAIKNGIFYCYNAACQVLAFDIETAELLWYWLEFPGPKDPGELRYLGNPKAIVLADNSLILKNNWQYEPWDTIADPGETGYLYAIDIRTHDQILWTMEIGLGSSPSVFKEPALYSFGLFARPEKPGAVDGTIYCLDSITGEFLQDHGICVNDDIEMSIGGEVMYLACWNFQKVFGVIFDPFEILWERDVPGSPFSAVVPVGKTAFVSLLDSVTAKTSLKPQRPSALTAGNIIITSFSEASYQKGDVSGNGEVTAYDASLVLRYVVGLIELSLEARNAADVSGNKTITALDAALILQYTVQLITSFPADKPLAGPSLYAKDENQLLAEIIRDLYDISLNKEEKQVFKQLKRLALR